MTCLSRARVNQVRCIEHADKNPKEISKWIQSIQDLHKSKPLPQVSVQNGARMQAPVGSLHRWAADPFPVLLEPGVLHQAHARHRAAYAAVAD